MFRSWSLPFLAALGLASPAAAAAPHTIYVSNERSGDVTVIDGQTRAIAATVPVGKRPRGIHVSPGGARLFVALSGSPRLGPGVDAERARTLVADKAADGIGIVDTRALRVLRKLAVGSDPEQFALSRDGGVLFVSNEDEAAASAWEIESGRRVFRATVSAEPEGVGLHPTRDEVYVTCEERGEVFVLDAATGRALAQLDVGGRPRTVAFSRDGARAYVPIEGKARVAVIDAAARRLLPPLAV